MNVKAKHATEPGGGQSGGLCSERPRLKAQPSLEVNAFLTEMFKSLFSKESNT